ncbi:MAG TPA: class I SAM-dependent methyltransferase [Polyangia bacterium]|nr:class I SAM-dependent methyltransferase [Polyangia bacterium]
MRMHNRTYYDEFSSIYEAERLHDGGYHAMIDSLEIDLALRYVPGAHVLEAGCGTGLILRRLAPVAARAVGVDLSAGMLRQAAARGLTVVQGSVTDLPFADASFDVVCSFKVLAHVEHIDRAVHELSRVTRPGGHLLLEFYNPWSLRYLVKRLKTPTRISLQATDESVYTRYDHLDAIRGYLPPGHEVVDLRGVRVVTPVSTVFKVPPVGRMFHFLETQLCDVPVMRRLGGFLIVVVRKGA